MLVEIFAVLGLFILIAIAKWSGNSDTDDLITIGAFLGAAYKIIPGIVKIINLAGQIRLSILIADLMKEHHQPDHKKDFPAVPALGSIQFRNVSFI